MDAYGAGKPKRATAVHIIRIVYYHELWYYNLFLKQYCTLFKVWGVHMHDM